MKVGLAAVEITPPPGLPLAGNFRDDYAARGVHDPLMAKAIVLEDQRGRQAAILAVDVCMLDRHNVEFIRRVIGRRCGVPPEHVLVHATHTHSGPACNELLGMGAEVAPWRDQIEAFLTKAASAVAQAEADLAEATLAAGFSREERVSFNRRLKRHDGTIQMNWEALQPGFDPQAVVGPAGPVDPELCCLVVRRQGRPVAAVVNFALHPAILAGDNWLYSADYPGCLAEGLGRIAGPDFLCLFLNGCCGDVNHVDYRDPRQGRGYQMAERVGYMLAAAAWEAVRSAQPLEDDTVAASRQQVRLDRLRIGAAERRWCERVLQEAEARRPRGQVDGLPEAYYAEVRLQMWRDQDRPAAAEVMALRVGEAAVVGLPGEVFCQLGLDAKRRSPARYTLTASLANDAIGYLPTPEAFDQGGYETTPGSTFFQPHSGRRLIESAVGQCQQLFSGDKIPSGGP